MTVAGIMMGDWAEAGPKTPTMNWIWTFSDRVGCRLLGQYASPAWEPVEPRMGNLMCSSLWLSIIAKIVLFPVRFILKKHETLSIYLSIFVPKNDLDVD